MKKLNTPEPGVGSCEIHLAYIFSLTVSHELVFWSVFHHLAGVSARFNFCCFWECHVRLSKFLRKAAIWCLQFLCSSQSLACYALLEVTWVLEVWIAFTNCCCPSSLLTNYLLCPAVFWTIKWSCLVYSSMFLSSRRVFKAGCNLPAFPGVWGPSRVIRAHHQCPRSLLAGFWQCGSARGPPVSGALSESEGSS